jgi:hypothetical protein
MNSTPPSRDPERRAHTCSIPWREKALKVILHSDVLLAKMREVINVLRASDWEW